MKINKKIIALSALFTLAVSCSNPANDSANASKYEGFNCKY